MSLFLRDENAIARDPCADKLSFEIKAQTEGAKALAKLEHGNEDLEAYKCEKCDLWHLATKHPEGD